MGRQRVVAAVAVVVLLSGYLGLSGGESSSGQSVESPTPFPTPTINRTRVATLVHARVNDRRHDHGLSSLERDRALRAIARNHSRDMFDRSYFVHTGPDGETRADRYDRAGYECRIDIDGGVRGEEESLTCVLCSVRGKCVREARVLDRFDRGLECDS